ncbi:MAG TPA: aminotransferase class V-fold PLP-dependent enzyme [Ktedonobacteraceae bacterium]|nr:aminotransferase class V-fold PLP-dependent enzyme [Ktedonobacteraceae bacterium]
MLETGKDIATIRQELPIVTDQIYLNTGVFGPLPRRTAQAMGEWVHKESVDGRLGVKPFAAAGKLYAAAREYVARLLNAESEEIALTNHTGEGLNIICNGFNWQPGDEVIITNHEYVSLIVLIDHLCARYGVIVRVADLGQSGDQSADEAIARLITSRTRLIVLSHIAYLTGEVLDVQAVAALARRSAIPLLVDGAQAAGVIPLDMKAMDIDFYACPMQKWLCGPDGTGALYVRREALDQLQPTYVGSLFSVKFEALVKWARWTFHDSAQRFEQGGRQTAGVVGQIASLRWLEETIGYPWIFERILSLSGYAYNVLKELPGLTVLTPHPGSSGLLTFTLDGCDAETIVHRLEYEHHIYLRTILEFNALRVSTGFYNTPEEIDSLARALYTLQHS